ncbi:thiolase family protein [Nakamurella sp. PAMC28650]|uniref:thiolase family protein n=1 Tax=Nakamurella sp. PAMC28650 TaxID=2762325 RepID=UPI00164EBF01|nr:thiolase family protein [Nakamurella sp. PAMC28650]QNK80612.1 thiolase family protein [Nakamurella sp. PAMC28650]
MSQDVYIIDAVRTPFGRFNGALAGVRPDDLAAQTLRSLVARHAGLDPETIDDVLLGNANGAGEENRNVARMAVLLAGWPTSVPGVTVNRLCGSGLEAAVQARRAVAVGDVDLVVAGGVESMTRAPWVVPKPERPFPAGHQTMFSTTLGWRLVNPVMDGRWTIALGESAEHLADLHSISREAQDEFALRSHRLAHQSWEAGVFADEVVPIPGIGLDRDESIRPDTDAASLAGLKPAFRTGGTVTAGNSSPLNDGAAAMLIGTAGAAEKIGATPLARIVSCASVGVDPEVFGIGPVQAARNALARAGIGFDDLRYVELNEAFAVQSLSCLAGWPELDPAKVNVFGGAIAIGHPLGASGARVLGALAHRLRAAGGGYGMATLCIGVGQGMAVVLEA